MPTQDRVRGHDQLQLSQPGPRKMVQERGQERPVRAGRARPLDLALQDGELVAQHQDLDVLVGPAHRQQPDHGEQARYGEVGQSQQHGRPVWHRPEGRPESWGADGHHATRPIREGRRCPLTCPDAISGTRRTACAHCSSVSPHRRRVTPWRCRCWRHCHPVDLEAGGQLVDRRPGLIGVHQRRDVGRPEGCDCGALAPESVASLTIGEIRKQLQPVYP